MSYNRQSFQIPEQNVVGNNVQQKNLQHRRISNDYTKQNSLKIARSQSSQNPTDIYSNPENRIETEINYYEYKNNSKKVFQNQLATFYTQQINRKQAIKKKQKQLEKKQEQQMIRRAQSQVYLDHMRTKQINEGFKKQALQLLQYRQERKSQQRRRLQQQKQAYQRRYSNNLQNLTKQQSFRKHYLNVNEAIQQNQRNYLSNVVPVNKYNENQKDRLIYDSSKEKQSRLRQQLQKQYMNAYNYRNQLRDSLVMQIRQKQQKKKIQKDQMRNNGYASALYLQRSSINNPLDFKITHDNRYPVKQLQSGLARSGSQSILS